MYAATIYILVSIGLLASTIYVFTWGRGALKAYRHGTTRLKGWEIVDFAALPVAAFLTLLLATVNIILMGIPPAGSVGIEISRCANTALIDAIVLLRLFRWYQTYRDTPEEERSDSAAVFERHRKGAS